MGSIRISTVLGMLCAVYGLKSMEQDFSGQLRSAVDYALTMLPAQGSTNMLELKQDLSGLKTALDGQSLIQAQDAMQRVAYILAQKNSMLTLAYPTLRFEQFARLVDWQSFMNAVRMLPALTTPELVQDLERLKEHSSNIQELLGPQAQEPGSLVKGFIDTLVQFVGKPATHMLGSTDQLDQLTRLLATATDFFKQNGQALIISDQLGPVTLEQFVQLSDWATLVEVYKAKVERPLTQLVAYTQFVRSVIGYMIPSLPEQPEWVATMKELFRKIQKMIGVEHTSAIYINKLTELKGVYELIDQLATYNAHEYIVLQGPLTSTIEAVAHTIGWQAIQQLFNAYTRHAVLVPTPKGLINTDNRCFMNAVVQALFSLPMFTEYILDQYAQKVYQPHTLSNYFGQLITALSSSQPGAVEVPEFCNVSWKGLDMPAGTPQDAREFTTMLLNTLIDQGAEKLAQLFGLYTQSFVTYTVTDSASTTPAEVHYALELPVPVQKQPVALEQLVAQFFSLQGVSNSGHETDILQQVTLAHTGAYVLISLKREKMDLLSNTIQKAFTPVSFNLANLSFKDYFITSDDPSKNTLYQLQAFVIHVGTGAGGHYFSYAKRNNRWYRCDDTVMVPVTQKFIQAIAQRGYEASLEHTPVLLFYQAQ